MEMEIEKPSICENVAELGLQRKVCRIRVVPFLEVLQPNSGRSATPLGAVLSQARVRVRTKTPTGLTERFYRPFKHGTADGGTQLCRAMARSTTALDGTFLRRHCGTGLLRDDHLRHRRTVSDVNSAQNGTFLR